MPCNRAMEIRRTVPRLMRIVAKTFLTLVFCGALLWMNACSVGPNYKRPAANVPTAYRGALAGEAAAGESTPAPPSPVRSRGAGAAPLGEEKWGEGVEDQELQGLIRTALKNNYDVRIAATRVLEAQAQLGITRADQLPALDRKSTRLNSSHRCISYAVFCLKKKKKKNT